MNRLPVWMDTLVIVSLKNKGVKSYIHLLICPFYIKSAEDRCRLRTVHIYPRIEPFCIQMVTMLAAEDARSIPESKIVITVAKLK